MGLVEKHSESRTRILQWSCDKIWGCMCVRKVRIERLPRNNRKLVLTYSKCMSSPQCIANVDPGVFVHNVSWYPGVLDPPT